MYAGATLVFYLFILMLLDLPGEATRPRFGDHWPFAALAGLSFIFLAWLAQVETIDPISNPAVPNTQESAALGSLTDIGMALFGPFALPFEIASLVLLAAIVGAVVLARRRTTET